MRDEKLWQEILFAPTALATPGLDLERAITKSLGKAFGLSEARCAVTLFEYRRFRYLVNISNENLFPSPLIAFILARDTPNSIAFSEIKPWSIRPSVSSVGSFSFTKNPAYQRTLELYQHEFAEGPKQKIWPTRLQARRANQSFAIAGFAVAVILTGYWFDSEVLAKVAAIVAFTAFGAGIFFTHHWGDPPSGG